MTENKAEESKLSLKEISRLQVSLDEEQAVYFWKIDISPDGKYLASSGGGGVSIWDWRKRKIVRSVGDSSRSGVVAFSPDGLRLAASILNGRINIWNIQKGRLEQVYEGQHSDYINAVAFSPDGKKLFSGDTEGKYCILWSSEGKVIHKLTVKPGRVSEIGFLAKGDKCYAAIEGKDLSSNIYIWDTATGELKTYFKREAIISGLSPLPDGKELVARGFDGFDLIRADTGAVMRHYDIGRKRGPLRLRTLGKRRWVLWGGMRKEGDDKYYKGIVGLVDLESGRGVECEAGDCTGMIDVALSRDETLAAVTLGDICIIYQICGDNPKAAGGRGEGKE